jgi:hypothetical protein
MNELVKCEKPRLIHGLLSKCNDGQWKDADGLPLPSKMLVFGIDRVLRCWGADHALLDYVVEQPGEPLPDVDELNRQIPQEEWGSDLNNQPRPPWERCWRVFLLDLETASVYTFINGTTGARIAAERLKDRIKWMREIRGAAVVPIVQLDSRPMKTKFGPKMRPEFTVIEWRERSVKHDAPLIEHQPDATEALGERLRDAKTEGSDRGGFRDGVVEDALKEPEKKKAEATIGKPVKPVTIQEELDDEIPEFGIKK